MKKLLLISILILTFLSGCSGLIAKSEVGVNDNIFYSSLHPNIKIKIDKQFEYIGVDKGLGNASNYDISTLSGKSMFVFANLYNKVNIESGIILIKNRVDQGYWSSDIYKNYNPKIYSENLVLDGKKYKSIISTVSFDFYEFTKLGYASPGMVIFRAAGRIVDPQSQTLFHILYFEKLSLASKDLQEASYANPPKGVQLNNDQERAIQNFIKRADNAVKEISGYEGN